MTSIQSLWIDPYSSRFAFAHSPWYDLCGENCTAEWIPYEQCVHYVRVYSRCERHVTERQEVKCPRHILVPELSLTSGESRCSWSRKEQWNRFICDLRESWQGPLMTCCSLLVLQWVCTTFLGRGIWLELTKDESLSSLMVKQKNFSTCTMPLGWTYAPLLQAVQSNKPALGLSYSVHGPALYI